MCVRTCIICYICEIGLRWILCYVLWLLLAQQAWSGGFERARTPWKMCCARSKHIIYVWYLYFGNLLPLFRFLIKHLYKIIAPFRSMKLNLPHTHVDLRQVSTLAMLLTRLHTVRIKMEWKVLLRQMPFFKSNYFIQFRKMKIWVEKMHYDHYYYCITQTIRFTFHVNFQNSNASRWNLHIAVWRYDFHLVFKRHKLCLMCSELAVMV